MSLLEALASRVRNLLSTGELKNRHRDGRIRVETKDGTTIEKKEAHPYGFKAKAKEGTVIVLRHGGNFDSFDLLPVVDYDGGPELKDGDTSLYTAAGGWIICRENGTVELFGSDLGGVIKADELRTQLARLTARVDGIMNALRNSPTAPNDGGSAYRAGITAALNALTNREDFSAIASEKVFHGSGAN